MKFRRKNKSETRKRKRAAHLENWTRNTHKPDIILEKEKKLTYIEYEKDNVRYSIGFPNSYSDYSLVSQ